MKKLVLLLSLMVGSFMPTFAQDTITMNVTDVPVQPPMQVCCGTVIAIYTTETSCDDWWWRVDNISHGKENPLILQSQVWHMFRVVYNGCDIALDCHIVFTPGDTPTSFTQDVWKRFGETMTIEPVGTDSLTWFEYQWSTGATSSTIDVTEPGTYTCQIYDFCGTATRTFIVRDNVEIYRSGVDPATNKNRVLWQTTPEQSAYTSSVKVERDGMVVGTVPYLDGQFLDNIGSENAARIYRITGIASDGTECPIPSYQFGTFNTIYSPDIANPNLMNFSWEDPFIEEGSPYEVVAYRIGKVDNAGEFVVIDQLSAQVHLGKYDMDLFNGDYGIVAAVFNDAKNRDYEELAFSNRSDSGIVGVEENGPSTGSGATRTLTVYPNPTNNVLFVETRRATTLPEETYRIVNPLGQTVMEGQITTEKQQIDVRNLPKGVYFITVGDATRKFVVE